MKSTTTNLHILRAGGFGLTLLFSLALAWPGRAAQTADPAQLFRRSNLMAWCIVPFDAKKRSPEERASMLDSLEIKKLAYDWREEHVPTFEQEIATLKRHGIEFTAFWDEHPAMFRLIEKHRITPQIWKTAPSPTGDGQEVKIEAAASQILPIVERVRQLGCQFGLYNHGGWGGEPRNLVAVCERLRQKAKSRHIGIVYNLHHAHDHIHDFKESLELMKPYLLCLNLNGMNDGANPKILTIGEGKHDVAIFKAIVASGYAGPFGIIDHRPETDSAETLRANLDGLEKMIRALKPSP